LRKMAVATVLVAAAAFTAGRFGLAGPADKAKGPKRPTTRPAAATSPATRPAMQRGGGNDPMPCVATTKPAPKGADIPRFAVHSPFAADYTKPKPKREKILWARSCLWREAPELVVEKWLTGKPDLKGKYVLIEFWATWCPPCRRSISLLNEFHKKYGKDLVVIGISDQTAADVRKLKEPRIEYFSAIDTQARMKKQLEVRGIPHVIVIEPSERVVIWEGFPLLKGFELTDEIVKRIVSIKPQKGK